MAADSPGGFLGSHSDMSLPGLQPEVPNSPANPNCPAQNHLGLAPANTLGGEQG